MRAAPSSMTSGAWQEQQPGVFGVRVVRERCNHGWFSVYLVGMKAASLHNAWMRAPHRRRPMRRLPGPVPSRIDLEDVVARVTYVGSGEHKTFPSFAGPPHPRADASKCDPRLADQDELTGWLQQAIREGRTGGLWEGDFPRYVWHRVGQVPYEVRLVNPGTRPVQRLSIVSRRMARYS